MDNDPVEEKLMRNLSTSDLRDLLQVMRKISKRHHGLGPQESEVASPLSPEPPTEAPA